jgi:DNA-binding response OmpR family regulator
LVASARHRVLGWFASISHPRIINEADLMNPTVLIAVADAEVSGVYRKFIAARGYETETAGDGLDCLAKLRRATPAVIVLDLELCWGGGDGVLAWLREQETPSSAAVILTAKADAAADTAALIKPPVVQSLFKPFALNDLLESIHAAVARVQAAARWSGGESLLYGTSSRMTETSS